MVQPLPPLCTMVITSFTAYDPDAPRAIPVSICTPPVVAIVTLWLESPMYIHGCTLAFGRNGIIETGLPLNPVATTVPLQYRFPLVSTVISEYPLEGPLGVESFNRPIETTAASSV